jgi:pimeloyl-ACP methyl ester carboxylesterase
LSVKSTADFVAMTRAALVSAGFVRHETNGLVSFESQDPGTGRAPIVLVHGANDQAGTWFVVAPQLAATRRVVIPDLPGHGESAPASGPLPMTLVLAGLEQLLSPLPPFLLVGNSLGGWLAALYALDHPERVRHLVLETGGGLARPLASPLQATTREEAIAILRNVHGPRYQPADWAIDSLLARSQDSPMLRITGADAFVLDARLPSMRPPVTLLWGADDGVLPVAYAEEYRGRMGKGELRVIEGAAHIPHLQRPEQVLQQLELLAD